MTIIRKIATAITAAFLYTVVMVTTIACNTQQGMMHDNSSMGMNNWNSTQTLTVLSIVCVVGLILWFAISRRRR